MINYYWLIIEFLEGTKIRLKPPTAERGQVSWVEVGKDQTHTVRSGRGTPDFANYAGGGGNNIILEEKLIV